MSAISTNSSANCENNDSLFSDSFSCALSATAGTVIVVLYGCLSGPSAPCFTPSAADSQGNVYHLVGSIEDSCDSDTCVEYGFWATASSTGTDTLTFTAPGRAYLGGDAYDVSGINVTGIKEAYGANSLDGLPEDAPGMTPYPHGFVVSGALANSAEQFTAGPGYTLIAGQPCYSCGMIGGWQASEYETWGANGTTTGAFGYPGFNDGWAVLTLSFAPNISTTSVTCAPSSVTVTVASVCTATVTGSSPTGTVIWTTGGTGTFSAPTCALSSGTCSVSYTPSAPSSPVTVTAAYGGDLNNPVSSGSFLLSVSKSATTTTVACSPSPVTTGMPTTCSASVSGASPTGTVTWASSGVANFSPSTTCTLSAGSCAVNYTPSSTSSPITITAVYGADVDNIGSTGTFMLSVSAATTTSTTSSSTTTASSTSTTSSLSTTTTTTSSTTTTSASSTTSTTNTTSKPSTTSSTSTASSSKSSNTMPSTSTASSTSSAVATTRTGSTSSVSSATTSSTSSTAGGGVPAFPYQIGVAAIFTVLLAASYLLVKKRTDSRLRI